jgi:hypothetical protein
MAITKQPRKKKKNLQRSGVRALDFRDHKAVWAMIHDVPFSASFRVAGRPQRIVRSKT